MVEVKKIKVIGYESAFPIKLIEIDRKINVRTEKINSGLEELKESIKNIGLIEPILVSEEIKGKKYKLIVGQRRLLAFKELKREKIPTKIIESIDLKTAQIISFSENLQRKELTTIEKKRAAKILFKTYKGNKKVKIEKISEDLGVGLYEVISWLQEDAVPQEVLDLVSTKKLSHQKAWQLTAALLGQVETIIQVAKEMAKAQISNPERDSIIESAKKNPESSSQEILKKSREPGTLIKVLLHLDIHIWRQINKQSQISGYEKGEDLIKNLIDAYLKKEVI